MAPRRGGGLLPFKASATAQCWDQQNREVDFNEVILFGFCFYNGADVYVMSGEKSYL